MVTHATHIQNSVLIHSVPPTGFPFKEFTCREGVKASEDCLDHRTSAYTLGKPDLCESNCVSDFFEGGVEGAGQWHDPRWGRVLGSASRVLWRQMEPQSKCVQRISGGVELQLLPCTQSSFPVTRFYLGTLS